MEKLSKADLEKEAILNPEKAEKRKQMRRRARLMAVITVLCVFCVVCTTGFMVVRAMGKSSIMSKGGGQEPSISTDINVMDKVEQWQEGWIGYKDKIYEYNDDIMTFLIMGIDKKDRLETVENGGQKGQADAIFLVVMNPHDKKVDLIAINRDTMADVEVYGQSGAYSGTVKAQIALQHAYGDGKDKSAKLMEKAVSALMYQLPIHGYLAVNMDGIPTINDTIGGVEVECIEDLTAADPALGAGENVRLEGETAFWYVKYRDTDVFESNRHRLERQAQYLQGFIEQARAAFRKDVTLPLTLFQKLIPYMTTDIKADEVTYLATTAASYEFSGEIYLLDGETKMGDVYEEFYPDEDALHQMVIDIFYEEVQQ